MAAKLKKIVCVLKPTFDLTVGDAKHIAEEFTKANALAGSHLAIIQGGSIPRDFMEQIHGSTRRIFSEITTITLENFHNIEDKHANYISSQMRRLTRRFPKHPVLLLIPEEASYIPLMSHLDDFIAEAHANVSVPAGMENVFSMATFFA